MAQRSNLTNLLDFCFTTPIIQPMNAALYPETARFSKWLVDEPARDLTIAKWCRSDAPTHRTPEADRQEVLCAELNRAVGAPPLPTADHIACRTS